MRNNNVSQNGQNNNNNNNNNVKQYTKEGIYDLLGRSDMAVVRGVEAIYARQTADERAAETTSYSNGVGFNGTDANILSSFAKQIANWRQSDPSRRYAFPLSPKQLVLARRKMLKYSGQLAAVANAKAEATNAEAAAEAAAERAAIQAAEIESDAAVVEFNEFGPDSAEVEDEYLVLS